MANHVSVICLMLSSAPKARLTRLISPLFVVFSKGGGYAYRLAPADAPLTEDTFRKQPLDFVGDSILRWDGDTSTQLEFNPEQKGWGTNQGTMPQGSMWRKVGRKMRRLAHAPGPRLLVC